MHHYYNECTMYPAAVAIPTHWVAWGYLKWSYPPKPYGTHGTESRICIWTGFATDTGMDMQPVSKGTDFYFIFNYFQSFSLFKLMFFLISFFSVTHHLLMTPWSTRSTIRRRPHNIHNGSNDHDEGCDKGDKGRGLVLEMHRTRFFFPLLFRLD